MVATFHLHHLDQIRKPWSRKYYTTIIVNNTIMLQYWVYLVTYNIAYILVCIFIKLAIFILFLLCSTVMFFMHSMLNILRYEKIFYEIDELIASLHDPSSDAIFLGVHSECVFPFMEITFSSWITLTISLDELNSIDWLLNCWWWIFLK